MAERVAVIGSRKGADLSSVVDFIEALHKQQPDTLLVSGGAKGVDQMAESTWFRLGGRVRSYRPVPWDEGYGVEIWEYSSPSGQQRETSSFVKPVEEQRVNFADYASACRYRDWQIADDCDRLVAFYRKGGSWGTALTESLARDRKVDVYTYEAA